MIRIRRVLKITLCITMTITMTMTMTMDGRVLGQKSHMNKDV